MRVKGEFAQSRAQDYKYSHRHFIEKSRPWRELYAQNTIQDVVGQSKLRDWLFLFANEVYPKTRTYEPDLLTSRLR